MQKVALITGAAHRIGAHIAQVLAAQGWAVALHYHGSRENAAHVCHVIEEAGGTACAFSADFSNEEDVQNLISVVSAEMGGWMP